MDTVYIVMIGKKPVAASHVWEIANASLTSASERYPGLAALIQMPVDERCDLENEPRKIAVNRCFGGLRFSDRFYDALFEVAADLFTASNPYKTCCDERTIEFRTDPRVIAVIEELGSKLASMENSRIEVVTVPPYVCSFHIVEHDGLETVVEDGWSS